MLRRVLRLLPYRNRLKQILNIGTELRGHRAALMRPEEKETELDPYNREILMLVCSDLRVDPRVRRQALALAARNFKVTVWYIDIFSPAGGPPIKIEYGEGITTYPLPVHLAQFMTRYPFTLSNEFYDWIKLLRPFAIHCHDAPMAMTGLRLARTSGAHWVVDFHEWYSENVTWWQKGGKFIPHPRRIAWVYRMIERIATRHAAATITVCETIAASLEAQHVPGQPKRVHVIRNIPESNRNPSRAYDDIRKELGLPKNSFVVLYQGAVGPTRNLETVLDAMPLTADNVHLVIRGPAIDYYRERYERIAVNLGVAHRVHCTASVPSTDVIEAAKGADVGLYTVSGVCKSFTAALPNKLFEYLYSNLPILTAHYDEARNFVEKHKVGLAFDPESKESIAENIERMRTDKAFRAACRANIPETLKLIDADGEWERLADMYEDLYAGKPRAERRVFGRDDKLLG